MQARALLTTSLGGQKSLHNAIRKMTCKKFASKHVFLTHVSSLVQKGVKRLGGYFQLVGVFVWFRFRLGIKLVLGPLLDPPGGVPGPLLGSCWCLFGTTFGVIFGYPRIYKHNKNTLCFVVERKQNTNTHNM